MTNHTRTGTDDYPFLSKVKMHNFKSAAEAEVRLAPFTLIVGENSSGKSNILQAIRLIKNGAHLYPQNEEYIRYGLFPIYDEKFNSDNKYVFLSGVNTEITRLSLNNIRTSNSTSSSMLLGLDLLIPKLQRSLSWEVSLDIQNHYISTRHGSNVTANEHLFLSKFTIRQFRQLARSPVVSLTAERIEISEETLDNDVVVHYHSASNERELELESSMGAYEQWAKKTYYKKRSFRGFHCYVEINSKSSEHSIRPLNRSLLKDLYGNIPEIPSSVTGDAQNGSYFKNTMERTYTLGPLRHDQIELLYTQRLEGDQRYGGLYGEFTPLVIREQGQDIVSSPLPGSDSPEEMTLLQAVRAWSKYLGLVEDIAEDGEEVKPHGLESYLPFGWVGVGVSQLLPVLVLCLRAEPGSVLLIEQPELHLHPALQQRLTDFFIAMVRSGRQLIVETHSEYMVSRLRRRIVEDPEDRLLDLAKVIFAERDRETGHSSYREVELSPYGAIEEWPAGFFDQAAEEERAIILGGVKKLRKRTSGRL